ncbi:hypothetical protein [Demequina sp. NBRC 110057]|uniref:aldose epimerase family protein n=1 Tax=Demequina sp. NBRC 110057 TaxID=1570346 RepID=UPI000A0776DC|nr:hypothetical protein [Demequina sp. NBRC 110057]
MPGPDAEVRTLAAHGYKAVVSSLGAMLAAASFLGDPLITAAEPGAAAPGDYRGAMLAPWPGRLADGGFTWRGRRYDVGIDEPERRTALHGRVADRRWRWRLASPVAVTLGTVLGADAGYPWRVDLAVTVAVTERGVVHTVTATNLDDEAAPLGWGVHPYLVAGAGTGTMPGPGAADGWALAVPAATVAAATPERLLPGGIGHVGPGLDLRGGRPLAGLALNHTYGDLERDASGNARVALDGPAGTAVEMEIDAGYRWLQVYTADEAAGADRRASVAVEPMTCPPDALNSGIGLIVLEPGATASAAFTLRAGKTRRGRRP